ncbi:MAG: Tm-1-like ATP-binding domain-containing protein [Cypionkella sp.]|nr:Tm-1-like ATP-binding domain-containing protein [Cypionkella sp.]
MGTADTKAAELSYLRDVISAPYPAVVMVDIGTATAGGGVDIAAESVATCHPQGVEAALGCKTGAGRWRPWGLALSGSSRRKSMWRQ